MLHKRLLKLFIVMLLTCMSLSVVLAQDSTQETLGTAQDLELTQDELNTAISSLGTDGFIGVIACTYTTDYHHTVAYSPAARATDLGMKEQEFDSDLNVDKQISAIENFTNSGAKAIVICLFDPPSVQSALQDAADKGVTIIQYAGRQTADLGGVTISVEDADLGR